MELKLVEVLLLLRLGRNALDDGLPRGIAVDEALVDCIENRPLSWWWKSMVVCLSWQDA